ncbi:hypothetical protein MTO96_016417 [Rhipicephalus appendiculatus]
MFRVHTEISEYPTEEHEGLDQVDASNQAKQRDEDAEVPHNRSSSDAVEDAIVPEHIQSPSNKSSTESESVSEKQDVVSNGGLKCAVEDFTRLISPDGDDIQASKKKGDEKGRIHDAAVIAEPSDDKVDPEVAEGERGDKNRERNAAGAKEDRKADNGDQEDSLKTDSSESFDLSAAGAEDNDSGSRNVKENTTHQVTEAVEQSERTEGGATGDQVRSTRIFQKTVKRTESTRTVRRTRSFLPYTKWIRGETRQRARQETRDEDDATEPVEETLVAPPASLSRDVDSSEGPLPDARVVEFDEPDCITRLVELQIAMNEQEEVRRQDMKAACELVEKLEAMQLSESLMRTQLRAMDAERREQSAREARLRDELTAWQETVQQQQLLLQQLKEDLDDTEDTLAAQRQEANRLREQMLVLQESCDSGLLMVDVLGRADKEVQTPDGGQQSLPSSSPYKGIRLDNPFAGVPGPAEPAPAAVGPGELPAGGEPPTGSPSCEGRPPPTDPGDRRSTTTSRTWLDKILAHTRSESLKSKEGQMTPHLADRGRKAVPGGRPLPPREPPRGDRAPGSATAASAGGHDRSVQNANANRPLIGRLRADEESGANAEAIPCPTHTVPCSSIRPQVEHPRRISFSSTSTTVNSRSHSVLRASQQRQLQARRPHATTATTTSAAASRSHARQSQPQSGPRQPTGSSARKTAEERVNRFVNTSREGNTSKR